MTQTRFHDAAPGLLTHEAFSFIVDHLLKHALRTQEFLTLVVFVAERESQGAIVAADEWIVRGLARLIRVAVRETDLLGRTADGMLSLMLAGIDTERATKVIHRLNEQLKRYGAASATQWSIGIASCPTHAIRVDDLMRYAIAERKTPGGRPHRRAAADRTRSRRTGRRQSAGRDGRYRRRRKRMTMQKSNATAGLLGIASAVVLLTSALGAQSQTPGTGGTTSLPPVVSASDYRLAPGDKLRVEVYKDAQLSQSLQIRPDGKVTLPLLGDIVATDLTPIQLRDRIATQLKEYVTNPVVTVIVVEASPAVVFVMGEVGQPGSIPMRGSMTVLQALAMAGGFKEFANTKDIRILRKASAKSTVVDTIRFNYNDAIKGSTAPVFLVPGDMIVVP